jgi:hypothetical protein
MVARAAVPGHLPVLRLDIHANPETNFDAEATNLRRAARSVGLDLGLSDRVVEEALTVVRDFVNRGRELRALGSHFQAEKTIRGDGYVVRVSFNTAQPSGLIQRVLAAFRR